MTLTQALNQATESIYAVRGKLVVDDFDNQDDHLQAPIRSIQNALGQDDGGPAAQYDIYNIITTGLVDNQWSKGELTEALKKYAIFEINYLPTQY